MGKSLTKIAIAGFLLCIVTVFLYGCGDSGCLDTRSSMPIANFDNTNSPSQQLSIDSISVYGLGQINDSLLLDSARNVSQISLPFRNSHDTTQYVIHYNQHNLSFDQYNDTLTFIYHPYPYFVSAECGAMFNYIMDKWEYTRNVLDSMAVVVTEITNENVESIKLFYEINK